MMRDRPILAAQHGRSRHRAVLPFRIVLTLRAPVHLPRAVAAALEDPRPGELDTIVAAALPWSVRWWGDPDDRPLVLIHGVTSSGRAWWRVGPALAATGRRVMAPDLPGHGGTGHWTGHHRFRDNARDVAALIRAAGLERPGLQVVGHSWGAMTAAALPAAGLIPETVILLDPPALPADAIAEMVHGPTEQPYPDLAAARAAVRRENPGWHDGDVEAKAEALVQLDREAARAVLLDNGDWDGGLGDLAHDAARDVPVWVVRGEESAGGLLRESALPAIEARVGAERVITIAGAPHSPQRTHPRETVAALLRALDAPTAGSR